MATSGTVGQTVIDVISVIEHAVRRCGVLVTAVPGEALTSARENLFMILSGFVTKGLQLWTIRKTVYPLGAGNRFLNLEVGSVDLQNVHLRSGNLNAATSIAAGTATYTPAAAVAVGSVVLEAAAGSYSFVLEGSPDGVSWTRYGGRALTLTEASRFAFDSDAVATLGYWRVRETLLGTIVLSSAGFMTAATEIDMTSINRDDYASMPNKEFASTQPLQFWNDRQASQSRLWLWPLAQTSDRIVVVWAQYQVEDVGELSNTLAIPQRWLDPVISELATRVCLELPKELVPPDRYNILSERAQFALAEVQDAEVDGAPVRLAPDISGYTA